MSERISNGIRYGSERWFELRKTITDIYDELYVPAWSKNLAETILYYVEHDMISVDQLLYLVRKKYTTDRLFAIIHLYFVHKLTPEQVSTLANPLFNDREVTEFVQRLKKGEKLESILLEVSLTSTPGLDVSQRFYISKGFSAGLSFEQVKSYAKPSINAALMHERLNQLRDQNVERELLAKHDHIGTQVWYINYWLDKKKPPYMTHQTIAITTALRNGHITFDQALLFAKGNCSSDKVYPLLYAFEHGMSLNSEQMSLVLNPDFGEGRTYELVYGLEAGFTLEQMLVLANPQFNTSQMIAVRTGFEQDLSIEQVKSYANPKIDAGDMGRMLWKLVNENRNRK